MSAILGTSVTGAGGGAYTVDNSVRLRSGASAYLNRTPSVAGNRQKFTWSGWVKRGQLSSGSFPSLFYATNGSTTDDFRFNNSDVLCFLQNDGVSSYVVTNAVFRDPSAWYHIVLSVDTTQATAANRIIIYVNGVSQSLNSPTYPTQNYSGFIDNNVAHQIGRTPNGYFDGYLSNINFIDGQALTPSSFGETNASTGVWQPKAYAGSYGTNGFYLKFSDIATTSGSNAGLGKDFSGNGNYWNTNNISVTAGVTYDAMKDSPTPASSTVGNFAVMNPLDQAGGLLVTNGNLTVTANSGWDGARATFSLPSSGKYYWEATCISRSTGATVGILSTSAVITGDIGAAATGYIYNSGDGQKYNNGTNTAYGATWGTNDIIGVAWDAGTATLVFYKNGVSQGTAWSGLSGTYSPAIGVNGSDSMAVNFGQRPFSYTPPTGYVALQSYNLPTPTVGASSTTLANKYFDATLYTGNGSTQSVVNSGSMQPDLVWMKARSNSYNHLLHDAVRGVTKLIISNDAGAEQTVTDGITSFNSNGFSLGANGSYNQNAATYVGWQWRASNTTAVTNTAGSITSTVSANTTSGFSVVTYTGNGSTGATVGHGLGVAPKMIIVKQRNGTNYWTVYQAYVDASPFSYILNLNTTSAKVSTSQGFQATSSSTFTIGTDVNVNGNGSTYVAYCFAEVAGFSKFGSYVGNGSADGPFVYLGFRPRFIMFKGATPSISNWVILDTSRSPYNTVSRTLQPNSSYLEETGSAIDYNSNGFKIRDTNGSWNASGQTFIYMAFAESPFNYSLAR